MKPRARWNPYGVGYWTVRSRYAGIIIQGIGFTLVDAYGEWLNLTQVLCVKG